MLTVKMQRRRPLHGAPFSALDLAALGELPDVFGRAECERLNGHRRLASARGHEASAIAEEQIRHVVGAVILVDHR